MRRVVIPAVMAMLLVSIPPAFAQDPPADWQVTVAPYMMGASMNGTTTVHGFAMETDASASDILSNLQFGAMGYVVARKGNWGVGGDAIWMSLGTTTNRPSGAADVNQGAFAFYGLRRLAPVADLTFGARINYLQGTLRLDAPLQFSTDQSHTWVDPLVGVILHAPVSRRVGLKLYTEIGGFGAGSKFEWQIFPAASITLAKWAALDVGYRWLDMNYTTGTGTDKFGYDVLTQGPVLGFVFKF
jgi:hypothetical protein